MFKPYTSLLLVLWLLFSLPPCHAKGQNKRDSKNQMNVNKQEYQSYTDTITLNGHNFFYACEGYGRPVILIHGNGGSHNDLETMHRQLAQAGFLVYAMDSRGQGANKPVEEYHYKEMAEDVLSFIKAKKISKPAIFGWSDGGIIALELESMHPGTCSMIVTSGANVTADNAIDPKVFDEIFGSSDSLPPLVRMMKEEPNMTSDDLQRIKCPTLICAGENDLILPEHTRFIAENIPGAKMLILPGEDHGSHIWHNPKMGNIVLKFMKEAEQKQ